VNTCGVDGKAEDGLVWRKREEEELNVGVEAVRMLVHADSWRIPARMSKN
jgi:hypothetical protein